MSEDGEVTYSNLDDDDAGTDQQDVNYFRPALEKLGHDVPESLFREVATDQRLRVGNRVVTHVVDE